MRRLITLQYRMGPSSDMTTRPGAVFAPHLLLPILALLCAPAQADEALAKKHNCLACHTVDKKSVGPAYKEIAKQLFRLYIRNVGVYDQIYGALGFMVALTMFVYYSGIVLVLGAEYAAAVEARWRKGHTL